jgi:hypothetical protein
MPLSLDAVLAQTAGMAGAAMITWLLTRRWPDNAGWRLDLTESYDGVPAIHRGVASAGKII